MTTAIAPLAEAGATHSPPLAAMTLSQRLASNRDLLSIPDPETLRRMTLDPERLGLILTHAVALIDAIDLLDDEPQTIAVITLTELADSMESAISNAVLHAQ